MPDTGPPQDIRSVADDDFWEAFDRRWTGLLSYKYLGRTHEFDANGNNRMLLRRDMRNPSGGLMAAPLCIASPESGGMSNARVISNPVIASMTLLDDARDVREIELQPEIVKTGRQMGFSRTRIVDADRPEHVVALSEGMGVSLGEVPAGHRQIENPPLQLPSEDQLPPLHEAFGVVKTAGGTWQLPELSDDLASPDAALHLGPIHVLLETAAHDAARSATGGDVQVESWHVMFVACGKVGPFPATCETGGNGGRIGCSLTLRDSGNDGRVVTTATAMFRRV